MANANNFGTDNRAFVPEIWAQESLMVLEENLVIGNMVHRDFSNEVAEFGDTVNTRKPGTFTMKRKIDGDSVTKQPATATKVAVKLNQHGHVSFIIYDRELTTSFQNLVTTYLRPAIRAMALGVDSVLLGQKYQFMTNVVGKLGTAPTKPTVIDLSTKMDKLYWPNEGRQCVLSPSLKGSILGIDDFTAADRIGDDGTAMRSASLGRYFNTDFVMSSNCKTITAGNTTVTGAINLGAGYAAGTTVVVVDGFSAAIANGSWITIGGDMTPHRVTATSGGATPIGITFTPALTSAVLDDAVVTVYTPGAINEGNGYAADYAKIMTVNGFTVAPQTGQLVSMGANYYSSLALGKDADGNTIAATTNLLVDRPLEAAVANADKVAVGPAGEFGLAFHRNAIALVSRPLALPPAGMGAASYVASYNGLSLRVTLAYDSDLQGMKVTVDLLFGVKVLDTDLGILFLG